MLLALPVLVLLAAGAGPGIQASKPPFAKEAPLLRKLAERVAKEGQEGKPDGQVSAFLGLGGKAVRWHSKFDSERQVQLFRHADAKPDRLIFLVPEKPFPEFGKTWVYCVSLDGRLLKAGVSEPREAYRALADRKQAEAGARAELDYWLRELGLKKPLL